MNTANAYLPVFWCSLNLIVATVAAGTSVPVAISPGSIGEMVRVGEACPTFSWTEVEGANAYDVAVWRLSVEAEQDSEPEMVILEKLPGGAQGWTPALGQCLERGWRYAWAVRVREAGGTEVWSEPNRCTSRWLRDQPKQSFRKH